jgi:NAD(P)-dependent dehydrogenase (short-subunit alcohol dehydrogenase family)
MEKLFAGKVAIVTGGASGNSLSLSFGFCENRRLSLLYV